MFAFGLSLVSAAVKAPQQLSSPDQAPKGLAKSDWTSIRAAYEAGRHAFQPTEGSAGDWHARNPGQQWLTTFDQRGFQTTPQSGGWTWGLELQSYGFGETQTRISRRPEVKAAGQRLSYQWDAMVQEWFVNDQRGLEHGFTVVRRPDRADPSAQSDLAFLMKTRGGLQPKVSADAQGVTFQDASGTTVLNYTGLKVWDADGKILKARFEPAGLSDFRLLVGEATARYPITIDPIAQQAYLKASNTEAGDEFGYSVAVSGDTAVIGAWAEDSNATGVGGNQADNSATDSGAAYVFTRNGSIWSQQAYLKASNSGAGDRFGWSVAVSGDTAVIGAFGEDSNATGVGGNQADNSATFSGAAYVFTRSGSTWSQQAYLKASNTEAHDRFGISVSVSGATAVIGAPVESSNATGVGGNQANNSATASGAAYVFTRSGSTWSQQAYLKASNTGANDDFGRSVAVSGDIAVIGATSEASNATGVGGNQADNSAAQSGAAYIFTRSGSTWSQQAYLKASNTGAGDQFGCSVAVDGDTAVIGAYVEASNATGIGGNQADNSASFSGAAYVFTRSAGLWSQQAYLKASNTGAGGDQFGYSVAVDGDTAVIGAPVEASNATGVGGNQADNSANASGATYVFTRSAGLWSQQAYLKASNTEASDRFGTSVAVSGDTAVIGAYAEDSNATGVGGNQANNSDTNSGAAYTFSGLGPAAPTATTSAASNVTTVCATLNGSANANGTSTTLTFEYGLTTSYGNSIAATLAPVSGSSALAVSATLSGLTPGATYHYRLVGVNGVGTSNGADMSFTAASTQHVPRNLLTTLPAPATGLQTGSQLGHSVAVDGNYTVLGAPLDDAGAGESGIVKVFNTSTGALLYLIPNPSPASSNFFGASVSISGTRMVVGAINDDTGATDAGGAYVYDLSSNSPTIPVATLSNPSPVTGDRFGASVSISGALVVVGAAHDDTGATDAGSAYVYDLSSSAPTVPLVTLNNPSAAVSDSFGNSVAISGTRVVVGAYFDDTGAINAGSAYVYDLSSGTPTVPMATMNNPSPAASDFFGISVAISGTRVAVGAYFDDTGATDAGSAYVYDLSSGTPTVPVTTLNNPGPATSDYFGYSVEISGTRVVVGAYQDDTGATNAGSAYAYDLSNGTPTVPIFTWNNPAPFAGDIFGYSVTISGTIVVIGAHNDDAGATDAGSAYIYDLTSGTPTVPTATLNSPGPSTDDRFGLATAISGTRMVVGMPREDTGASNAGSVFVYDSTSGTPAVPVFTLSNPGPAVDDNFGNSVAIQGSRVLVGAPFDDTTAANSGAAYFYDLSSGTPTVPVYAFINPVPGANDNFGNYVALEGTLLVIAAAEDDTAGVDTGSVYVYDLASATPTTPAFVINNPSPASGDDSFGSTVGISGRRIIIAAVSDDPGGIVNAGSVYAYDLNSGTPTLPVAEIFNPAPAANNNFGYHAAISGTRIVVGALADDTLATDVGSAYIYDLTSGTPTVPIYTLPNPSPVASDNFGHSVAIAGNWVTVGASNDGTAGTGSGTAYFYDLASDSPTTPLQTLLNPSPSANDDYGLMMAMDGQRFVVGSPFDDMTAVDKGAVYLYGPSSTPEIAVELLGDAGLTDASSTVNFGYSAVGFSSQKVFRITNQGGVDLTGLALNVNGANAADFSLSTLSSTTLAPGASTTFTVTFTAGAAASRIGDLHITCNDPDESQFDITLTGAGQPGGVDLSYDVDAVGGIVRDSIELPSGKIMIGGWFSSINGVAREGLARLNGDGTLDTSFAPVLSGTVYAFALLPDGKLLIGGSFTITSGGSSRTNLARLDVNGNLDTTMPAISLNSYLECLAVQFDGKMLIGGWFTTVAGQSRNYIARINTDGSLDLSYDPNASSDVNTMVLQPDGKMVIGGQFSTVSGITRNRIARINTDGTVDAGFNPNASSTVEELAIQSDGKILMGGYFTTVGGVPRSRIARLNVDGSLDTGFDPVANSTVWAIEVQSDGKILAGGDFTTVAGGLSRQRLARFNSDGSVDSTFRADCDNTVEDVMVTSDGRIVVGGGFSRVAGQFSPLLAIMSSNGTVLSAGTTDLRGGSIMTQSLMAGGKLVIGGSFSSVNELPLTPIARLLPSGIVDPAFTPPLSSSGYTYTTIPQGDGRLIYQDYNTVRRLNADGSLDSTFASFSTSSPLNVLTPQSDGKILVGGSFSTLLGQTRNKLARVNADGTLDTGFNPNLGSASADVWALAVQPDGKILVGGTFTTVGGVARNRIARLNADGSLDTGFDPGANSTIYAIQVQPDGKILVGGAFTTIGGISRSRLARLNSNGTLDGFAPQPSGTVYALSLQADGKIWVGGSFTVSIGGGSRNRLARLNANGSLDTSIFADLNDDVYSLTQTGEGQVLIGGAFSHVNGVARTGHARLANTPAMQSLTTNSTGTAVTWVRAGSSPEVDRVTFESSLDGSTWTSLGNGIRAANGWQLTGLTLPAGQSYQVRAQGIQMTGGFYGGDSSIYETVALIPASAAPEIVVEQPANAPLTDAVSTTDFSNVDLGSSMDRTYTIRNTGSADLTGLAVTVDGPHAADFSVLSPPAPAIAATGSTVFTVRFTPSAQGMRHARMKVWSNDADESPFDVALSGEGTLPTAGAFAVEARGGSIVVNAFMRLNEGKTLMGGSFESLGAYPYRRLVRLGVDGNLDTGFELGTTQGASVIAFAKRADGKVWMAFNGSPYLRLLNADGTWDATLTPAQPNNTPQALAMQADGKLLIGGQFTTVAGVARNRIARLNADGTLDTGFNPDLNGQVNPGSLMLLPDGKIMVGGAFTTVGGATQSYLARLNADGTLDSAFAPVLNNSVNSLALQADEKILVGGSFTTVNGLTRNRIARFNADGALDITFDPNANGALTAMALQSDGKILLGGSFTTLGGVTRNRLARVNADGTLDSTYNPNSNGQVMAISLRPDGSHFVGGFFTSIGGVERHYAALLNADGTLNSGVLINVNSAGVLGQVVMPDGRVMIGGNFSQIGSQTRSGLARLNADLSLDAFFSPSASGLNSLLNLPDGRLLLGGNFTNVGGITRNRIAIMNADGSVESAFNPDANNVVASVAQLPDGKLLVGGDFSTIGGVTRNNLARLNADGTLDAAFTLNGNGRVQCLVVQPDGKVLVGGSFTTLGGTTRNRLARLNSDGTLDAGFNPNCNNSVNCIELVPDGKILVGGFFTSVGGVLQRYLTRLNANGTLDASFNPNSNDWVYALTLLTDGRILVGGNFTQIGGLPRNRLALLSTSGVADVSFNPNVNDAVYGITVLADGRLLVGGIFSAVGGIDRQRLALLPAISPVAQGLAVNPAGNTLAWMRSGGAAEVERVTFESSADGSTWTSLGSGSRITGGWQLTGLSLSLTQPYFVRVRGLYTGAGLYGHDGSLYETVAAFNAVAGEGAEIAVERPAGTDLTSGVASFDLGTAQVTSENTMSFTLKSTGNAPLSGLAVSFTGAQAGDFQLVGTVPAALPALNGSQEVTVRFLPRDSGPRNAVMQIWSNDTDESPFLITLTGTGSAASPYATTLPASFTESSSALLNGLVTSNGAVTTSHFDYGLTTAYGSTVIAAPSGLAGDATGLVSGTLTGLSPSTTYHYRVRAVNSSGATSGLDATFTTPAATAGELDLTYPASADNLIRGVALQPDGRLVIGGSFTSVLGVTRNRIARLNTDGTLDNGFNPTVSGTVNGVIVMPDGKLLIYGVFTTVNGTVRNRVALLNADGTLDATFNPNVNNTVLNMVVQPDGRMLVSGFFTTIGGVTRNRIARIEADGSLEMTFNPDANNTIQSLHLRADGRILAGGDFTTMGGQARNRFAQLEADGSLSPDFNLDANSPIFAITTQPDGKVVIGGGFTTLGGVSRSRVARLNVDGSLDTGFMTDSINFNVNGITLQTNGKMYLTGQFTAFGTSSQRYIARVNADGSFDSTFNVTVDDAVEGLALDSQGRIHMVGAFLSVNSLSQPKLARLHNASATQTLSVVDYTRVQWLRSGSSGEAQGVTFELSTDGGANFSQLGEGSRVSGGWDLGGLSLPSSGHIRARARMQGGYYNGSIGYTEAVHTYTGLAVPEIAVFKGSSTAPADELQSSDEFTFAGTTSYNTRTQTFTIQNKGQAVMKSLAVTHPVASSIYTYTQPLQTTLAAGTSTTFTVTFTPDTGTEGFINDLLRIASSDVTKNPFNIGLVGQETFSVPSVLTQGATMLRRESGQVLATVWANAPGTTARFEWGLTTAYGNTTTDEPVPFVPFGHPIGAGFDSLQRGTTYHYRAVATNAKGTTYGVDRTFTTPLHLAGDLDTVFNPDSNGQVTSVAVQPDGKVLLGGDFTLMSGQSRTYLARMNADGTLDTVFVPSIDGRVNSINLQPDGKIVIAGNFSMVNSASRSRIARLNADGTLDAGFSADADRNIYPVLVQREGGILVGGLFDVIGGISRTKFARLHADGSVDTAFNPVLNGNVIGITQQTDGKIIITGDFTTVNGTARNKVARLLPDGTLDSSFLDVAASGDVWCSALQPDGKILIGGDFTNLSATTRHRIARLNEDGSIDSSFNPGADAGVTSLRVRGDGRIMVVGTFGNIGGEPKEKIARLNADGSVDAGFVGSLGATATTMTQQKDGRLWVGGLFTTANGLPRNRVVLFDELPTTETLQVTSPTRVEWLRSGGLVEPSWVSFEFSTDGGSTWTAMNTPTRTPGGWQSVSSLPSVGQLRARASIADGVASGSLHETIINFSGLPVPDIAVFNGSSTAPADARTDNVGVFDFGPLIVGGSATRTFTVRNSGSGSLSSLAVSLSSGGDFARTNPAVTSLSSGASATFTVTFAPTTAGIQTRTVLIASDDADENPFEIQITGHGQIPPAISGQPTSALIGLGQPLDLGVAATGTALQYEWRRNGVIVPASNAATFAIAAATLGHVGEWQVRVFNGVGSALSQIVHIGVVDLSTRSLGIEAGQTLVLQVAAAAPQATYRWLRGGVAIPRGINPETMLVLSGIAADQAGNYSLQVSMADPQNPGTPMKLSSGVISVVVNPSSTSRTMRVLQKPVLSAFAPGPWIAGSEVREIISAQHSPMSFTVKGLPPGVKLNTQTGELSGRASVILQTPKRYALMITASNAVGTSAPLHTSVVVQPLPGYTVGSYHGIIARDESLNAGHGGRITLTVSALGAVSGKLTLGALSHAFAGNLDPVQLGQDVTGTVLLSRSPALTFTLHRLTGELTGVIGGVAVEGWRQATDAGTLTGGHNLTLNPDARSDSSIPQALGSLRVTVTSKAGASWAGRLGDGTGITGSSGVSLQDSVPVNQFNTTRKSSMQGWLEFTREPTSISGQLDWVSFSPTSPFPLHILEASD